MGRLAGWYGNTEQAAKILVAMTGTMSGAAQVAGSTIN